MERVHRESDEDQRSVVASSQARQRFGREADRKQDDGSNRERAVNKTSGGQSMRAILVIGKDDDQNRQKIAA